MLLKTGWIEKAFAKLLGCVAKRPFVVKMISRRDIKQVCVQIAREFRPRKIILFGSYA
jgi:hypothetical protein